MDVDLIRAETRRWLQRLEGQWLEAESGDTPADPELRKEILATLRQSLEESERSGQSAVTGESSDIKALRSENARLRAQLELNRTAYDYLVRLAHHFSGEETSFDSPEQIRAFCERIKRSAGMLVQEFQELLSGRKKVQTTWSLYSSATAGPVGEMTRQIRLGDMHGDLGKLLFDWRAATIDEESTAGLKLAIDELKHHQLAIMAGYERCVREGTREILEMLAPATLEQEIFAGESGDRASGGIRWRRWLPGHSFRLWRRYKKRYGELAAEDDRWYQARFLPAFREGYRDYMWAKTQGSGTLERPKKQGGTNE
ncbi:MAG: type VI secretion system-associated FHA domain protein [Candidatus Zixiibacteriota bacterium]